MTPRISDSIKIGPFRIRISMPLGKGRTWIGASTRVGGMRVGVSEPVGKKRRRRR